MERYVDWVAKHNTAVDLHMLHGICKLCGYFANLNMLWVHGSRVCTKLDYDGKGPILNTYGIHDLSRQEELLQHHPRTFYVRMMMVKETSILKFIMERTDVQYARIWVALQCESKYGKGVYEVTFVGNDFAAIIEAFQSAGCYVYKGYPDVLKKQKD